MTPVRTARFVALSAASALVAGAALVLPAAEAAAAPITAVAVSGLAATTTLPASGDKAINFKVTFNGDPVTDDNKYYNYTADYSSSRVDLVSSRVASPLKPRVVTYPASRDLRPNTPISFQIKVSYYTSPGKYTVKVPIMQQNWATGAKVAKWGSGTFTVLANTSYTKARTSFSAYGKFSKKAKWTVNFRAEEYQRGATLTMYYKASGAKKYKKIASKKLDSKGDASFKTAKGKIRKSGKVYFKVGGVSFAGGYKTAVAKVKKV